VSSSLTAPLRFVLGDIGVLDDVTKPDPELELDVRTFTPARHARHGSYRARRGLEAIHEGHIGRLQQLVVYIASADFGGRDDEHARQRVVLRSWMVVVMI